MNIGSVIGGALGALCEDTIGYPYQTGTFIIAEGHQNIAIGYQALISRPVISSCSFTTKGSDLRDEIAEWLRGVFDFHDYFDLSY